MPKHTLTAVKSFSNANARESTAIHYPLSGYNASYEEHSKINPLNFKKQLDIFIDISYILSMRSLTLLILLSLPLLADVKEINFDTVIEINKDLNKTMSTRKRGTLSENNIIDARHSLLCLHNNYDAIKVSIVDLIIMNEINQNDLELIWWRSNNPTVRTLALLVYYKKYGNKITCTRPNFVVYTSVFATDISYQRLKEIHEVYRFLYKM